MKISSNLFFALPGPLPLPPSDFSLSLALPFSLFLSAPGVVASLLFLGSGDCTKVQFWLWNLHKTQTSEPSFNTHLLFLLRQASQGRSLLLLVLLIDICWPLLMCSISGLLATILELWASFPVFPTWVTFEWLVSLVCCACAAIVVPFGLIGELDMVYVSTGVSLAVFEGEVVVSSTDFLMIGCSRKWT